MQEYLDLQNSELPPWDVIRSEMFKRTSRFGLRWDAASVVCVAVDDPRLDRLREAVITGLLDEPVQHGLWAIRGRDIVLCRAHENSGGPFLAFEVEYSAEPVEIEQPLIGVYDVLLAPAVVQKVRWYRIN